MGRSEVTETHWMFPVNKHSRVKGPITTTLYFLNQIYHFTKNKLVKTNQNLAVRACTEYEIKIHLNNLFTYQLI